MVFDKKEKREVYSDEMKLRILCRKITANFLQNTRTFTQIELSKIPVSMTYTQALSDFLNEVNRKFPLDMSQSNRRDRSVIEFNAIRGRGRGRGRGGARHSGRGRGSGGCRHPEDRRITGTGGKLYEIYASYKFQDHVWQKLLFSERTRFFEQRTKFNNNRKRSAQQISIDERNPIPSDASNFTANTSSIIGGQNEEVSLKSRTGTRPNT